MCGICGIGWYNNALIKKMTNALRHRGPDDMGMFSDDKVSLGHTRLSIIDLSKKGAQPMSYDNGNFVITFNGEIYNYKELQEELKTRGHHFTSNSDTEVLLAGYAEWGANLLPRLNGMFAFCIYDKKKEEFFLARDRFGIKPLYYTTATKNGKIAFSSEISSLQLTLNNIEIDKEAVRQYFTFRFTLGEHTMLEGIKKLLPGYWLSISLNSGKQKKKQWYSLKEKRVQKKTYEQWKKGLRKHVEQAVTRRMMADVPVSTFLSGGIDSSIITLLAKKHNPQLNTFSMGFETTNELPYARLVAEQLETQHHEIRLDKKTILNEIEGLITHIDEPIGDPGFLPMFVLSKEVAKHNKVVLSGDGGDEILTGYDRYKLYKHGWFLRHLALHDGGSSIGARLKAMRGKDSYEAFFEIIRLFDKKELHELGIQEWDGRDWWNQCKGESRVEKAQHFDIMTLLPGDFFMKADKMSSAWGLEQRVPFLDHELVEFAFSIPLKHKLRLWNEKKILKESFKNELPKEITARRKHGFNVPIDYWFKLSGKEAQRTPQEKDARPLRKIICLHAARTDGACRNQLQRELSHRTEAMEHPRF
jgi:asparagine synthase (glutamine-hydrolysing)